MFCCRSGHIEWTDLQLRIKTCKVSPEASKGEKMKRLIVGISGASGAIYGVRLLQVLRDVTDVETHLVMMLLPDRRWRWKQTSLYATCRHWRM